MWSTRGGHKIEALKATKWLQAASWPLLLCHRSCAVRVRSTPTVSLLRLGAPSTVHHGPRASLHGPPCNAPASTCFKTGLPSASSPVLRSAPRPGRPSGCPFQIGQGTMCGKRLNAKARCGTRDCIKHAGTKRPNRSNEILGPRFSYADRRCSENRPKCDDDLFVSRLM